MSRPKKGVMPPQFAKRANAVRDAAKKAKAGGASHAQITKHATAALKHIGAIAKLAGK